MPAKAKTTNKPVTRSTARKSGSKAKSQTKAGAILSQLRRPSGASIAQLQKVTGWQPHSIRATLTGLRKQGHGAASRHRPGSPGPMAGPRPCLRAPG